MPFNNHSKHNYNENRKKYHNNRWIRTNPFPEHNEQWHLDEHKWIDWVVRYHIFDFKKQYQSRIQKRNPWWMRGAKVYQIIQWNKHRCLCTPDDYYSIFSIEYIGSIQSKRVCNEQIHSHAKKRHSFFECAYARMYEWKQVWLKLRISFIRTFLSIPIIRPFLYGHKGMCEHYLKSASSSGKPFPEQSSSHTSRVLIRKNWHLSRSHT